MSNARLYEQDFFAWANGQATLLRAGRLSEVDIENIAEEIETLGRREKREFVGRLKILVTHLLKWRFQPTLRGTSWRLTIEEQRREVADHIADNPSLKDRLPEAMASAFAGAILVAARETGLDRATFAPARTWSFEQIMTDDFYPDDGT